MTCVSSHAARMGQIQLVTAGDSKAKRFELDRNVWPGQAAHLGGAPQLRGGPPHGAVEARNEFGGEGWLEVVRLLGEGEGTKMGLLAERAAGEHLLIHSISIIRSQNISGTCQWLVFRSGTPCPRDLFT